ncbi:hypothetical protein C1646_772855 [Rhizophagus diaphanus]|nr:hypothetical protein C1646_772855 [Rhizophagus diaphanus] [Rhizophagus sp. MUCL 43196]
MSENKEIETPSSQGTHGTFSFLAPHYRDFNNDTTFGEGDTFLDFATSSATSSATRGQPLFTPSKNAKTINEKLTAKSPLKEKEKIKFLDYNLDVKAGADKKKGPPVVNIVNNKANIKPTNTAKQVKNYFGRKSQGIQKRQPIKRFHTKKSFVAQNSPFISLEKTPDRFKSKLVTMRSTSNYVNLPTKTKSPFLRTKLRAERTRMKNKGIEINNDKVQSKPVDSSDTNSGRVKKTEPFKFKAKPLANVVKFNLHIDARIEKRKIYNEQRNLRKQEEKIRKQKEEEERNKQQIRQLRTELVHHAKPAPNLLQPYRPKKSDKSLTETVKFNFHTDARLEKRKEQRNLREQDEKIRKQIEVEERNKQQIRQLRTELVHHAKPAPNLLQLYRPKKSDKSLTETVQFNFHTDARIEKRKEQRNLRE